MVYVSGVSDFLGWAWIFFVAALSPGLTFADDRAASHIWRWSYPVERCHCGASDLSFGVYCFDLRSGVLGVADALASHANRPDAGHRGV